MAHRIARVDGCPARRRAGNVGTDPTPAREAVADAGFHLARVLPAASGQDESAPRSGTGAQYGLGQGNGDA
ncbi:hypothetical protein DMC61_40900, partial [Amycolatopsis sp. WAC 04169]